MRKVIGLALAAAFALAASASARSDAVAVIDPKSAAEFVLNTCLPAMDDLQKVEVMARENNWFPLPYVPSNSNHVTSRSRWRANGFFVATWTWIDGNLPSCVVRSRGRIDDRESRAQSRGQQSHDRQNRERNLLRRSDHHLHRVRMPGHLSELPRRGVDQDIVNATFQDEN